MNNLTQNLIEALVNKQNTDEKLNLDDILKVVLHDEIEKAVNQLIGHEFNGFIGYEKNEQGASKSLGNSRNGYYERSLNTTYGPINVKVPRDRNSDFECGVFDKYKRSTKNIGQMILKMYNAGFTDTEIQDFVETLYGHKYSTSTISYITDAVEKDVENFKNRPLKNKYFALFVDSTYIPLRRNTVDKEAINIIMGIDMDGNPEILAFSITPNESKEEWGELFSSLNRRGVKDARILISDGFAGIEDLMKNHFPSCLYQRCFIHIMRNLSKKVRKEEQQIISQEFMKLAKENNVQDAIKNFEVFLDKWSHKYIAIERWSKTIDRKTLFNFYRFPEPLRGRIYTNNRIESFNKEIKRQAKSHIQRCSQEAEEKFLVSLFLRYNLKIGKRTIHNSDLLDCELENF